MRQSVPRLLVLTPSFPYPPTSGGDIRAYHLLRRLARCFEVHLLAATYGDRERLIEETGIAEVHTRWEVPREPFAWRVRRRIDFWRDAPHGIRLDVDPALERAVRGVLKRMTPDAVLIDHLYMMQYAKLVRPTPVFYSATDVETTKFMRWHARDSISIKRRVWHWAQQTVVRQYESRIGRLAEAVFATSGIDRDTLERMNRGGRFLVATNGVDLDYFQARTRESFNRPPAILFVGSMFYKPNYQGILFFLREVFPLVQREIPEATCHLVGKTAGQDHQELHNPEAGVHLHGYVEDVRPFMERCQVVVVPLFIGSGTRIKIVETMASGTPVVATSVGAEGITYSNGEDVVIADAPEKIAHEIVALLKDRDRCARIGAAGRRLVEREYTWERSAEVIRGEIVSALQRSGASK
jgi:glycosyltransferase involved in cell wall biosynthesis